MQLRASCQRPNEDFEGFGNNVIALLKNTYPEAVYSFKVELARLRDHFIQEVALSDDLREKVFMSQPEAVHVVRRLESICRACKAVPSAKKGKSVITMSGSAGSEAVSSEIRELKEFVLGVNETTLAWRRRNEAVCFACRELGHFARNCPHKEGGNKARACREPGSPRETWSSGLEINGRQ